MAISVDTVYQTVQDLLNVEQRGYLPGRDFNNFANLAQRDLFGKLFTDKAHFMVSGKGRGSELPVHYQEKIDIFVVRDVTLAQDNTDEGDRFELPTDLYMLETVYYNPTRGNRVIVEQIDHSASNYVFNSPLTAPSALFPKYERYSSTSVDTDGERTFDAKGIGTIEVRPFSIRSVRIEYVKTPSVPIWGARSILGVAQFDDTISNDFDLHPSMFDELVDKITYYAALSIKQDDVAVAFQSEMQTDNQIDKS